MGSGSVRKAALLHIPDVTKLCRCMPLEVSPCKLANFASYCRTPSALAAHIQWHCVGLRLRPNRVPVFMSQNRGQKKTPRNAPSLNATRGSPERRCVSLMKELPNQCNCDEIALQRYDKISNRAIPQNPQPLTNLNPHLDTFGRIRRIKMSKNTI